jgi:hypothetical protein
MICVLKQSKLPDWELVDILFNEIIAIKFFLVRLAICNLNVLSKSISSHCFELSLFDLVEM